VFKKGVKKPLFLKKTHKKIDFFIKNLVFFSFLAYICDLINFLTNFQYVWIKYFCMI